MAAGGTLLNAPDVYMDKIAIGPGYPPGVVDLDAPAADNIRALAKAKGVKPEDITALILERPRHADLVAAVRKVGASVRFITDGDIAGVIHTTEPDATGIDIYLGIGGASEGVLAAAALEHLKDRAVLGQADPVVADGEGPAGFAVSRGHRHERCIAVVKLEGVSDEVLKDPEQPGSACLQDW